MKVFVVDSSVAVKWISSKNERFVEQANALLSDLEAEKVAIAMPELSKYEIGNALLYKKLLISQITPALGLIYDIPIHFYNMDLFLAQRALEIGYEYRITYYDASFIS